MHIIIDYIYKEPDYFPSSLGLVTWTCMEEKQDDFITIKVYSTGNKICSNTDVYLFRGIDRPVNGNAEVGVEVVKCENVLHLTKYYLPKLFDIEDV